MNKWTLLLLLSLSACAASTFLLTFSFASIKLDHEVFRVQGTSMEPALADGDLLVVAVHTKATQVVADYTTGDIIVFFRPEDPAELVAHRAVEKYIEQETWYFVTKGDHNPSVDHSRVPESCVFGKIVAVNTVPALMLGASGAWYVVICGFAVMSVGFLAKINRTSRRIHPTSV